MSQAMHVIESKTGWRQQICIWHEMSQ